MSRRRQAEKRQILPDAKYNSLVLAKFMNVLMEDGKKSVSEGIVYGALGLVGEKTKKDPMIILDEAVRNASPLVEVRSRRVGGATYQVPVEVNPARSQALALRWIIRSARARSEKTMQRRVAGELMDAANKIGSTVRKREETHKMADANKAFAHFRW
ncbi:MAG: 30S ribosomal protein S7 [Alphaproteobacteria bacterium]